MNFAEINFPPELEYSSDGDRIPLEFYLEIIPNSKVIYLKLGYFSSKAIQVLAYSFAQFIYNGGKIKIISNHFLYKNDQQLLETFTKKDDDYKDESLLSDIEWLKGKLSNEMNHVIDCLKFLVKLGRLEIVPVKLKPGKMVHYKQGIFIDNKDNVVLMDGSCNFTANGLLENGETLSVSRSWGAQSEKNKINTKRINIETILNRSNEKYKYLSKDEIIDAVSSIGRDKDIEELLIEEKNILNQEIKNNISNLLTKYKNELERKITIIKKEPRFPFSEGPRDYQNDAYNNWIANDKKGIFAMATGTGKTITALNCLLSEYKDLGFYSAIILVPSKTLLKQWYKEVNSFNFKNIYRVSSDYSWRNEIDRLNTSLAFNKTQSFIVISTYQTFSDDTFQNKSSNFPSSTVLIADEAHNIGSDKMKKLLPNISYQKRIALSATPQRRFDEEGNLLIEKFFNSKEPYTYAFSMERAIKENILCSYNYHPHKVYLNDDEMDLYSEISRKLQRMFDSKTEKFRNAEAAKMLLLERRRIIHKAENKLSVFNSITNNIFSERGDLNFSFVYVPEGEDAESRNILDLYMAELGQNFPGTKIHHYTSNSSNRDEIMRNFEDGYINCLFSMKCLDEGVDIPRAEIAIFCASTGNPRQFIQRRGRVLRTHKDKTSALIHDLVVIPLPSGVNETFQMERSIIKEELIRVIYFASLSRNYYQTMEEFAEVAEYYDLNMYSLEHDLQETLND